MTVYSKESGLSSEKKDLISDPVTVEVVCSEKKALAESDDLHDVPLDTEYSVYNDPVVPIRRQGRPVQRRICLQLCLFVGMLVGLSISILASLYLYQTMTVEDLRYRGRCGVGVVNMPKYNASKGRQPEALRATGRKDTLLEDVDIRGNEETISVPKSDLSASANITHYFNGNITAIRDLDEELCYILPLLEMEYVPSPRDFYRVLSNMREDDMPYLLEHVSDYVVCNADECSLGFLDNLLDLCGEYRPLYAQPMINFTSTQPDGPSTESLVKTLERMFRSYAGGDAVVTYHIVEYK